MSRLVWVASASLVLTLSALHSANAQSVSELFDSNIVHDVRLSMNSRDLRRLRDNYLEDTYYPAVLEWRGVQARNVAVRSRGLGSRNPVKFGLRIDVDRFVSGQRFVGLKALVLDNLWQDPSFIREHTTMALFARLGQPVPRESFARLWINDSYEGLYALVEPIDEVFLARAFGDDQGYLFEYQWLRPFHGEYLGRSLERYRELFEAETHELEPDAVLYAPIHDLFREANETLGAQWRTLVERYVNFTQLLTHVAVESFVSEADGVLGYDGMNNFFLYRPPGATEHQFIAWDRDNAFQAIDSSILTRASENILFQRAIAHEDLRELYFSTIEQCARVVAQGGWLESQITRSASLIRTAVYEDPRKPNTNAAFDNAVAFLRDFAQTRPRVVLEEVARLRTSGP